MPKEIALDVGRWVGKSKEELIQDFSSALLELSGKVNPYYFELRDGVLYPQGGTKPVKEHARRDTPVYKREFQALEYIETWSSLDISNHLIWISGPTKDPNIHPKARFGVSEKVKINNQIIIANRSICAQQVQDECLQIAEVIAKSSPLKLNFSDIESLRKQPIPFMPPEDEDWASYLSRIIAYPFAWDDIKSGTDIKDKEKAKEDAREIVEKHFEKIQEAKGKYAQMLVGAKMEQTAAMYGYDITGESDCGISNTEALGQTGGAGAFDLLFRSSNEWKYVKQCGCCKIWIGKYIRRGYICVGQVFRGEVIKRGCGKVYLGC